MNSLAVLSDGVVGEGGVWDRWRARRTVVSMSDAAIGGVKRTDLIKTWWQEGYSLVGSPQWVGVVGHVRGGERDVRGRHDVQTRLKKVWNRVEGQPCGHGVWSFRSAGIRLKPQITAARNFI